MLRGKILALPMLVALLFGLLMVGDAAPTKPNVIVFLSDDHGFLDSSVSGSRELATPSMVRLAEAGITLTHAFVAAPSCAPSRAALLTGLMPARNGAEANHARPKADLKKLPAYLQELGYEVVAFGKVSHYKHTADYGFEAFAHDGFHDHEAVPAALRWLQKRQSTKPLCMFVGSNWPHVPWPEETNPTNSAAVTLPPTQVATPETRRARRFYYAAVSRMDAELGRVYDAACEKLGTNTLFLHLSDHGSQFPFAKWNCYDAGIRTTMLAVWPGVIKAGSRSEAMISLIDILPTLVEAAGGAAPPAIDGASFLVVLKGEKQAHRQEIFATHTADGNMNVYPMRTIRTAQWKYIRNLHPEFRFTTHIDRDDLKGKTNGYWGGYWASWVAAARTNQFAAERVSAYHERPPEELYDLVADPHELRNLAAEPAHQGTLQSLRARLLFWMKEQGDKETVAGTPVFLKKR